jgi:hypothetical protein
VLGACTRDSWQCAAALLLEQAMRRRQASAPPAGTQPAGQTGTPRGGSPSRARAHLLHDRPPPCHEHGDVHGGEREDQVELRVAVAHGLKLGDGAGATAALHACARAGDGGGSRRGLAAAAAVGAGGHGEGNVPGTRPSDGVAGRQACVHGGGTSSAAGATHCEAGGSRWPPGAMPSRPADVSSSSSSMSGRWASPRCCPCCAVLNVWVLEPARNAENMTLG